MAKDSKQPSEEESYGSVVLRLEQVVQRLEGGELSLEESLQSFEEGIRLVRAGEKLLSAAERRVEELLAADGAEVRALVTGAGEGKPVPQLAAKRSPGKAGPSAPVDQGDDIPF